MKWRPIETAPKDGTSIIVYRPTADDDNIPKIGTDNWATFCDGWAFSGTNAQPTLWQPMPKAPAAAHQ